MEQFNVRTSARDQMIDITEEVSKIVSQSTVDTGVVVIYVPHTTAGITINENADPDVIHDLLAQLDRMVPHSQPFYRHVEGNSAAHVKASIVGASAMVLIDRGRMVLGQWQGLYFCEFDGPRTRRVLVDVR